MSEQGSTGPDAPEQAKDDAPEQAKDDAPEQAKDDAPEQAKDETTRRVFMAGGAAAALGAAAARAAARAGGPSKVTSAQARLLDKVTAAAGSASLSDVRHIVILMQENRSFDHYFGTLSGVRGFSDPGVLKQAGGRPVFDQYGYQPGTGADASGYMQPFRLLNNPPAENGEATNDISHGWVTQHQSWNNGAMDSFVRAHLAADGSTNGPVTMGYFTRSELAFYYALADAFTVCDNYFCSVLGPTDPNRLMAMSAWIDPAGQAGGPVITTAADRVAMTGALNWKTMPEALLEAGVSWKVYNDPTGLLGLGVLSYFKNYTNPLSVTGLELIARGLTPSYPGDFKSDVKNGTLPSVSWIVPPLAECEHPAAPPEWGEYLVQQILSILVSNPAVWAQTVFIVNYDENGGFFDHVPPPAAPAGSAGEYLTGPLPSSAGGIAGPVGLGFRTPCLVISPFSAGGYKYSGVLDHTSTLRLIESRFNVTVPNLSAWRRSVTGDFTGALALANPPVTKVPALPSTSIGSNVAVVEEAVLNALTGTLDVGIPYPLPASNSMPSQETSPARPPVP
ncbi:MAG TPA: alkaline phosphatase family protein [Trebonia sp.]|nr:alkaline phosphatase family protein [Trebonia sp.]